MKKLLMSLTLLLNAMLIFAQQENFDVVTFNSPTNWTFKPNVSSISYTMVNGKSWAQIAIYKHRKSEGDIKNDFNKDWEELVSNGKKISSVEKTSPKFKDGWFVMSGKGIWRYEGNNVVTILSVYSNQKISVAILCNATAMPYFKEYESLIGSLNIHTPKLAVDDSVKTLTSSSKTSIAGLWADYSLETAGSYSNGTPKYTAGYLRKEYAFYTDGTYIFRNKQWITKTKDILFIYETGTYTIKGDQITIIPQSGKGEFWEKVASTEQWGKFIKAFAYKLEKASYTFKIIEDPNYSNTLVLNTLKPTQRDGGKFNAPGDPYAFHYSFRKLATLIDYPPGFK